MQFEQILSKVVKPSKYIPLEKNPFKPSESGTPIALINAGNYESGMTSVNFQSLYAVLSESTFLKPYRFFKPEFDFLELILHDDKPEHYSTDDRFLLSKCSDYIVYINSDDAVYQFLLMKEIFKLDGHFIVIQESEVINPLIESMASVVCVGSDMFKLKTVVKNATTYSELNNLLLEGIEAKCGGMSALKGFGSLSKFITTSLDVKNADNQFSYLYQALERQSADLFNTRADASDAMRQNTQKRLNALLDNIPNENELSLFPLGISSRIRQLLNVQETYLSFFETIKSLLAQGWRTVHLYFWIGHPLEDHPDWREFKKELQSIEDYVENFKKISIHLHFGVFVPSPSSPFLWDDVINPESYKEKIKTIQSVLETKAHIRASFEPFSAYFMRLFGLRGTEALSNELSTFIRSTVAERDILTSDLFVNQALERILGLDQIFMAQPFNRNTFNTLHQIDTDQLKLERQGISKRNLEPFTKEFGKLNLNLIKKALFNHNIHLSKTLDSVAQVLATEEVVYGRSAKLRASQQQDVARKYRIRFKKTGDLRFYSHIEVRKIILDALSDKKIPVVMTKGYTPHPKLAFAMVANMGTKSVAEYLDIEINSIKHIDLVSAVNDVLPEGLHFLDAIEVSVKASSLASVINLQVYQIEFQEGEMPQEIIEKWLKQTNLTISRETKNSIQEIDIQPFIQKATLENNQLELELIRIDDRLLKIEEFLSSLNDFHPFDTSSVGILRKDQFIQKNGERKSPFES